MRRQTGYGALIVATLMYWGVASAIAWGVGPPAANDASSALSSIDANPDLNAWLNMWRTFAPGLDGADFHANSSEPFPIQDAHRFVMPKGKGLWDFGQWAAVVSSPDGSHAIGWSSDVGEPDSQAYLIDLKTREAVRVLSCGTPCRYDLGAWLDAKRFVVAGTEESSDRSPSSGHNLWLSLFDLDAGVVTRLKGPFVNYSQLEE